MKWPFVSRAHHEFVVADLQAQRDRAVRDCDRAEAKLFELLYTPKEAMATQRAVIKQERDEQQAEIDKALDHNPRTKKGPLRARLGTWAVREIENGNMSLDEVTHKLRTWGNIAPDDDDEDTIAI